MKTALRLKAIRYGCDFRKADWRLYQEFSRDRDYPGDLGPGECYLFVSGCENQILWILNQQHTENSRGYPVRFTDSRRWRFSGTSKWDPTRLRHFADLAGIQLIGIRTFDHAHSVQRESMRQLREKKRQEKREKQRQEQERFKQLSFHTGAYG